MNNEVLCGGRSCLEKQAAARSGDEHSVPGSMQEQNGIRRCSHFPIREGLVTQSSNKKHRGSRNEGSPTWTSTQAPHLQAGASALVEGENRSPEYARSG